MNRLKHIKEYGLIFCLLTLTTCVASNFPKTQNQFISRDSLLVIANTIIDSADSRVLITVDEEGCPHARAMSVFLPEDDNMVVQLGTSIGSRKVQQIKDNPNVVVYFYDTDGASYVSLIGKARLVSDPEMKAKYWKEGWTRWYPDRDKDYVLIEVTPERIEMFSFQFNLMGSPPDWIPPTIHF